MYDNSDRYLEPVSQSDFDTDYGFKLFGRKSKINILGKVSHSVQNLIPKSVKKVFRPVTKPLQSLWRPIGKIANTAYGVPANYAKSFGRLVGVGKAPTAVDAHNIEGIASILPLGSIFGDAIEGFLPEGGGSILDGLLGSVGGLFGNLFGASGGGVSAPAGSSGVVVAEEGSALPWVIGGIGVAAAVGVALAMRK